MKLEINYLESQCRRCEPGHITVNIQTSCCGICSPCLRPQFANTTIISSEYNTCPDNMWGNNPLNGSNRCQAISESYLDPSDAEGVFLIIL